MAWLAALIQGILGFFAKWVSDPENTADQSVDGKRDPAKEKELRDKLEKDGWGRIE